MEYLTFLKVKQLFCKLRIVLLSLKMTSLLLGKLLDCAKAIESDDLNHADSLFKEIRLLTTAETNSATIQVVKYFAEALVRRLYKLYPRNPRPLVSFKNIKDYVSYEFNPFLWFANHTILSPFSESLRGKRQIHIIDFSFMVSFWLYYRLMTELAQESAGSPLSLRMTFIGPKLSKNVDYLKILCSQLSALAETLQIDFKWEELIANSMTGIVESTHKLSRSSEDEAVVVKWQYELHKLLTVPSAINLVMSKLKDLKPEIMVIVEQEANHNNPDLLSQIAESFKFYSIIFESIEKDRFDSIEDYGVLWERFFRLQICKLVAQEGTGQAERHETWTQWQDRLCHAGFHPIRLWFNPGPLFSLNPEFEIEEKNRRPLLCRLHHPLAVTSAWKPDLTQLSQESADMMDLESMLASFNIEQDAAGNTETASNSESLEDETDDARIMMKGYLWSKECFSINQIAASAEIFNMLEYVCHEHYLPLALTWISDKREIDKNSRGEFTICIESTACFVNDVGMKGFFEACVERPQLQAGQGIAGKALVSNMHFVPEVSKLNAKDYPFYLAAMEFGLQAVVAVKLESTCLSSVAYVLELFLPLRLRDTWKQLELIDEISSTLSKNCRTSWIFFSDGLSGLNIDPDEAGIDEVGISVETPTVGSGSSSQALSDIGSLNTNDRIMAWNMVMADGEEKDGATNQVEEESSIAAYANDDGISRHSSHKRRRTSEVWNHFDEVREDGGIWARCKVCQKKYRGESSRGTTNLRKHLNNCPGRLMQS